MGLEWSITTEDGRGVAFKIDSDEVEMFRHVELANPSSSASWKLVFDGDSAYGSARSVAAGELRRAIDAVLKAIDNAGVGGGPIIYRIRCRPMPQLPYVTGSGASGARLNGDVLTFWGGVDRCIMEVRQHNADGGLTLVRTEDIRDRAHVDTDNLGRIFIAKRRRPGRIRKGLSAVCKLLDAIPATSMTRILIG